MTVRLLSSCLRTALGFSTWVEANLTAKTYVTQSNRQTKMERCNKETEVNTIEI